MIRARRGRGKRAGEAERGWEKQGKRLRNIYIVYLLFAGLTKVEKVEYGLLSPEEHR